MHEKKAIYQPSIKNASLRQGEILTDVVQYNPVVSELSREAEELSFEPVIHPYAIIVTQDCDLDWDYRARQSNDFKKIFGIDASTLYCQLDLGIAKRRTLLSSPYLEHFSQRYYSFHSRVALPYQYESE
ncbi:MAG: hypothetical protein RID09_02730 [Coleofasciculus sp. G1-WW12-02]|uniref:hypothetical protein n=1 Tax=Coleofasciculus sp. G1-WW12-02 TaxID=3068483 RepID=UPI0032F2D758